MRERLSRQPDIVGKIGGELGRFARDERGGSSGFDYLVDLVGAGAAVGGGIILVAVGAVEIAGSLAIFEAVDLVPNLETMRQSRTLLHDGVVHIGQGSIGVGIGLGIGALFDRLDRIK